MLSSWIEKWRQLSWADRELLVETAVLSLSVRLILSIIPFRLIAPRLGQQTQTETSQTPSSYHQRQLTRVRWAIQRIAHKTEWKNSCLVNAIIAKLMLRWRGIGTQLFLGLAHDKEKNLQAHAWLRCGSFIVTGENEHDRFVVMTSFSD